MVQKLDHEEAEGRRGGTSLAAFLVINPILILFFQNCSIAPTSKIVATNGAKTPNRITSSSTSPKVCKIKPNGSCLE
jgi:hypothetical protein